MNNLYAGDYKRYMLLPAAIFIIILFLVLVSPGIRPGIDLKGGNSIILRSDKPLDKAVIELVLKEKYALQEFKVNSVSSPSGYGLNIEFAEEKDLARAQGLLAQAKSALPANPEIAKSLALQAIDAASKFTQRPEGYVSAAPADAVELAAGAVSVAEESFNLGIQETIRDTFQLGDDLRISQREVGATLGKAFYDQGILAGLIGFVLVVIIVFLFFRELVPSLAILAALAFDILGAMAMMALLAIPVTLSTIPALLMLIGISIDANILLTTRVLMRKDASVSQRAHDSMVTGLTMTAAQLAALLAMMGLSYFWQIQVVFEISVVLFFGVASDIIATWLMNAPILLWYVEARNAKEAAK